MRRDSKSKLEGIFSGLLWYLFYCFRYSSQEKVVDLSTLLIVPVLLWVLKSRASGGRLSYYHSFFYCFGYSSQEKVEDISTIIHFFKYVGYSSQEKVEDATAIIILFLLLWVLTSRESEVRLNSYHTLSDALGTQVRRKWSTSQLLSYFFYCFGYSHQD